MTLSALLAGAATCCAFACLWHLLKLMRSSRPSDRQRLRGGLQEVAAWLGGRVSRSALGRRLVSSDDLESRIVAAGEPFGLTLRDWLATKAVCAFVAGFLSFGVAPAMPGRIGIVAIFIAPIAGFLLPDFWLARAARRRAEQAVAELPDLLDLLKVAIEGGQAPVAALASVGLRFDGVLAGEWRRTAMSVRLGQPFDRALASFPERIDAPAMVAFSELMRGAHRHGLSLGEGVGRLAVATRHARAQRVRERAARSGPKIQLVVSLVLVPSTLMVIAAGVVVQLGESGLTG